MLISEEIKVIFDSLFHIQGARRQSNVFGVPHEPKICYRN